MRSILLRGYLHTLPVYTLGGSTTPTTLHIPIGNRYQQGDYYGDYYGYYTSDMSGVVGVVEWSKHYQQASCLSKPNSFDECKDVFGIDKPSQHNDCTLNINRSGWTLLLIPPHRSAFFTSYLNLRGNL